jgi:hypothetical protein
MLIFWQGKYAPFYLPYLFSKVIVKHSKSVLSSVKDYRANLTVQILS